MKQEIEISIDKSCSENWNSFDKNQNGGFCERCKKTVIDFTKRSDNEIFEFFYLNQKGICGRFNPTQLKKYTEKVDEKNLLSKAAAIAVGVLAISQTNDVIAQSKGLYAVTEQSSNSSNRLTEQSGVRKNSNKIFTLKGRVASKEDGLYLPGISISIKRKTIITATDKDGNFELNYSGKEDEIITLIYSFIGLQTLEQTVILKKETIDLGTAELSLDVTLLGEVCVIPKHRWTPRAIWWKIKGVFR